MVLLLVSLQSVYKVNEFSQHVRTFQIKMITLHCLSFWLVMIGNSQTKLKDLFYTVEILDFSPNLLKLLCKTLVHMQPKTACSWRTNFHSVTSNKARMWIPTSQKEMRQNTKGQFCNIWIHFRNETFPSQPHQMSPFSLTAIMCLDSLHGLVGQTEELCSWIWGQLGDWVFCRHVRWAAYTPKFVNVMTQEQGDMGFWKWYHRGVCS